MKYQPKIVLAYFKEMGLPVPELEFKFHPERKWRFDFAWPDWGMSNGLKTDICSGSVALEVDGGIWIKGGHNRGAQMLKTWEKENEAVARGWRIIRCEPKSLCTQATVDLIKRCLV